MNQNCGYLISRLKENPNVRNRVQGFLSNTKKKQTLEKARKLCYDTYKNKSNNYKTRLNAITEVLKTGFSEEVAKRITNYLDMAVFSRRYMSTDRPLASTRRYFRGNKTKPFSVYARRMQDIMNVAHNKDERKRLIVFFRNTERYLDSRYRTNQNSIRRQRGETQNRSPSPTYRPTEVEKTNLEKEIHNALRCPQKNLTENMKTKYPGFEHKRNTLLRQACNSNKQVKYARERVIKGKGKCK